MKDKYVHIKFDSDGNIIEQNGDFVVKKTGVGQFNIAPKDSGVYLIPKDVKIRADYGR